MIKYEVRQLLTVYLKELNIYPSEHEQARHAGVLTKGLTEIIEKYTVDAERARKEALTLCLEHCDGDIRMGDFRDMLVMAEKYLKTGEFQ